MVDAGEYSNTINKGLASFREVDATGNTCGSCHAPDGLDIVYHALPDDDFTRRTEKHVANQHVGPVVEMLNAHRSRYGWSPTVKPEDWKPMQPSGSTLEVDGFCETKTATTVVSGNLNSIERQRQMSILIMSHEMRMHMAGTSTGLFSGGIGYPVNAIWNTGVLAEQSGEACTAARAGFGGPWDANDASKAACIRMPGPWNSEHDRSTCTHAGRCDFSKDLISFGLSWRWMGFMQNPALLIKSGDTVTSETTVAKKVGALTSRLTDAGYHTHGV